MDILFLIGRILFGGYFFMMGLNHFMKNDMLTEYASSKGVPNAQFAVYLSGLLILLGGLGVVLGVLPQISLALIIIFLLPVSFQMHDFWNMPEGEQQSDKQNFLKNMALVGAALMLLTLSLPWMLSL